MSRITKEEIEKTKCGRFLLSDENIYLSIYSLNSYVFEYNLLNTEDRILYHRLQDKFDARLINRVITRVRKQIIELLDEDKYIEAKVYFKPKKLSENGELEFRPLHSTDLITQIAIVSMLHLFVYEIPEEEEGDPKLRLSNLSRLIPSDFYGNRISVKPEYLFKPWKQQYQKYNQNSNDALMKYHTSLEYKYEVTLDLENFFPTINPIIIYHYVINHLPAYLNDEEREMMKRVLQKLLFCKLTTTFDEKTAKQYYKVTKGAGNYDNVDKKERNEKECWDFKENSDKFVRGIPQGLPQSYFLGNIYMISIAEIFRKKFTGVSYFYVDDSVIFTNDVREDNFKEQLKELNKQIADEANNFEEDSAIYPEETEKFYRSNLYGVNVHLDGKSNYTRLDNLDDSEVYLKCISREMSQAGNDFFRMYSDEENRNLEEKLDVLSKQVKAKRDQLVEEKSQKRDSGNEDAIEKDEDDTQKFEKRLTRYYRFFEYRKQRLVAMHQPENGSDEDYKKKLEKIIYSELSEEDMEDDEKILQAFMNSYGADIWDAAIGMYQTFADDKEQAVLKNYILKINELCYGKASVEFSYLECTYRDLLRNKEENDYSVEDEGDIFEETLKRYMTEDLRDTYNDPYKTLKYLARMQESLTVLVGPNNSGKTTLISVLKGMFCDKKLGFSYSDIPISLSSMWLEKTVPVFQEIMLEYDKEKGVQKIIDEMTDNDKLSKDYTIDNFRAQIQVDYDPDSDNIQYFADYLMDLDDTKHSFYFIYTYEPSITAFEKGLNERYNRMAARVRDIENPGCIEKETKFYFLKEELLRIYCNAVIEKCYFCNSNYKNENSMEVAAFKSLFNFQNIPAMRELDDNESDSSKGISKRVIALLKDNDTWVEATKKLPDLLMADIEDSGAKKEIKNSSIKSLDDTIRDISKTSGGHIGKLQLEMDVKEQDVEEFIRRITRAKYDVDGLLLNEESQGLGFSNLIYLHMRLEEFYKSIDKNKVNVFFIEEPESHMHPQMQNVFIRFLKNYYIDKKLQGLITTHSNEIASIYPRSIIVRWTSIARKM